MADSSDSMTVYKKPVVYYVDAAQWCAEFRRLCPNDEQPAKIQGTGDDEARFRFQSGFEIGWRWHDVSPIEAARQALAVGALTSITWKPSLAEEVSRMRAWISEAEVIMHEFEEAGATVRKGEFGIHSRDEILWHSGGTLSFIPWRKTSPREFVMLIIERPAEPDVIRRF